MPSRTVEWSDPMITARAVAGKTGLEFLRAIASGEVPQPPIGASLGFALVAADEGYARFEATAAEWQYNPMAGVHGGVLATLLDSAMGCAVMTTCDAQTAYTTAELKVNFTRPVTAETGAMVCEGRIIHRGGRVATAEGKLFDGKGKLLAHGTTTCLLFPR